MLITTFGPPSAFTQWGVYACRILVDVALRDLDYVSVGTIDQLRTAWSTRQQPHLFFFSDCPDRGVVEVFRRAKAPALIFCEEPADITSYIIRERSMDWPWALRLTNQCLAAIGSFLGDGHSLVLRRTPHLTVSRFVEDIAEYFGLPLHRDQIDEILSRIDSSRIIERDHLVEEMILSQLKLATPQGSGNNSIPLDQRRTTDPIHESMRRMVSGVSIDRFSWPIELFIPGDRPNELLDGPIDMTGPARCLTYGPYLHLPVGIWRATLSFVVWGNTSGNMIEIDVYHGNILSSQRFRLSEKGRFDAIATFAVVDPREAVQIRTIMMEGAIEGMFSIVSVEVERVADRFSLGTPRQTVEMSL